MAYNKRRRSAPRTAAYRATSRRSGSGRSMAVSTARSFRPRRARNVRDPGYVDLASAAYALDTTGSVTLLNTIPQGAGTSERVGRRIALKGLQCRGRMENNSTATANDVAYLIVYDKRPEGTVPVVTDILETASSASMNNNDTSSRFRILKRVDNVLIGNSTTLTDGYQKGADWYLPLRGMQQTFNSAGTGAIGDIQEGALYLVTVGNKAAGTTAANLVVGFRTTYNDI